MSYGNNRYLRISLILSGRSVFLKKIEFNMFNIIGIFKSKEPQKSSTDTDEGKRVNFKNAIYRKNGIKKRRIVSDD